VISPEQADILLEENPELYQALLDFDSTFEELERMTEYYESI
jgi:hypothetical protein